MPHITFIHGISNKPPESELLNIWVRSLAKNEGLDLDAEGATYSMVYWADVMYAKPDDEAAINESLGSEAVPAESDEDQSWRQKLRSEEKEFVDKLAAKLDFEISAPGDDDNYQSPEEEAGLEFERIPLPWFIKRRVMKSLLRDVHHYLFNVEHTPRPGETFKVQDEIRSRMVSALKQGNEIEQLKSDPGKHVIVSHSMGTVIAYDCLKRIPDCPSVSCLMTIGSPLGLDEIQDLLKPEWNRSDGFPVESLVRDWINIYDRLDPVAGFDTNLANDYQKNGSKVVNDINEQNHGKWRHSISKYLGEPKLRSALSELLFND